MNVIFEAICRRPSMAVRLVRLRHQINGTLVPRGDGRWLMAVQFVPDRHERSQDSLPNHCRDLIRRGVGLAPI